MYEYETMRAKYSVQVSQTIDSPIMVFDYFEITEVFSALVLMLLFGIVFSSWKLLLLSLFLVLGVGPILRRRYPKGFFFHYPYRKFGMRLPGLINPKGRMWYSD